MTPLRTLAGLLGLLCTFCLGLIILLGLALILALQPEHLASGILGGEVLRWQKGPVTCRGKLPRWVTSAGLAFLPMGSAPLAFLTKAPPLLVQDALNYQLADVGRSVQEARFHLL